MTKIPVRFEYEGQQYLGRLDEINGMAGWTWHLYTDKDRDYWGRLRFNDWGWFFDAPPKYEWLEQFTSYFSEIVMLWYE